MNGNEIQKINVVVTEDNGGNLALTVLATTNKGEKLPVYVGDFTTNVPRDVIASIADLMVDPVEWELWDGNADDPQAAWDDISSWLSKSEFDGVDHIHIVVDVTISNGHYAGAAGAEIVPGWLDD